MIFVHWLKKLVCRHAAQSQILKGFSKDGRLVGVCLECGKTAVAKVALKR